MFEREVALRLKPPFKGMKEVIIKAAVNPENMVHSMTLPTGTGKTLNVLRILNAIIKDGYGPKRLIYVLPFVSLVSQTEKVYKDLFGEAMVQSWTYISQFERFEYEEVTKHDFERMVAESVEKPIVITTLARSWNTFVPLKPRDIVSRRFFYKALVVFDEVQTIPVEYWLTFAKNIEYFYKKFKTRFILMTATMPKIFGCAACRGTELQSNEVIIDPEKEEKLASYYRRRRYPFLEGIFRDLEDLCLHIPKNKRTLLIVNTVSKAYEIYFRLKELGAEVITSAEPKRLRESLLNRIRRGDVKLHVATQTIEAGADVSFDVVYRELAPVDGIIQAGGRCNRDGLKGDFEVRIFRFVDTHRRLKRVYGQIYADILNEILQSIWGRTLSEKEVYEIAHQEKAKILEKTFQRRVYLDMKEGRLSKVRNIHFIEEELEKKPAITKLQAELLEKWKALGRFPRNFVNVLLFNKKPEDFMEFPKHFLLQSLPLFSFRAYNLPQTEVTSLYGEEVLVYDTKDLETLRVALAGGV